MALMQGGGGRKPIAPELPTVPRWNPLEVEMAAPLPAYQPAPQPAPTSMKRLGLADITQTSFAKPVDTAAVYDAARADLTAGKKLASGGSTKGMNPAFAAALAKANAAMQAAGLGQFAVTSGWRSNAQQADLYRRKPGLAARPGTSWHERGTAVDINWSQLNKQQRQWLEANLPRYGIDAPGGMNGRFHRNKEGWHFQWYGGA